MSSIKIGKTKESVYTLLGIIEGITADSRLNEQEIKSLQEWLTVHDELRKIAYVSELCYIIKEALADGVLEPDEKEEILEYCRQFPTLDGPANQMKREMLILHGFMQGIAADEELNQSELKALEEWMEHHRSNIEKWPYNTLSEMLQGTILKQRITKTQKDELLHFCHGFQHESSEQQIEKEDDIPDFLQHTKNLKTIQNIYDDCPVEFNARRFCLSGNFKDLSKDDMMEKITAQGGQLDKSVTNKTDYLVVGSISSSLWKCGNYGTKIQGAIEKRASGGKIKIISEEQILGLL